MNHTRLLLTIGSAIGLALVSSATVLVDHNLVNDLDRTNENLPTESAWWKGGGSAITITESAAGLVWTTSGTSRFISTNFVSNTAVSTNTATVGLGEKLVMEYTFRPSAVVNSSLGTDNRFFLVGTAGAPSSRYLADNTSTANGPSVENLVGYGINFQISDTLAATALTIRKINSALTSTFSSSSSFSAVGGATTLVSGDGKGMASGALYTIRLNMDYAVAGSVTITASMIDVGTNAVLASVRAVDSTDVVNTFDALMYRSSALATAGGDHTVTNFSVEVIPEPSTYALLAGALVLGVVAWRRRRT